jgi:3-phosphoglycerate kinase
MQTIDNFNFSGKKVFVRVDFNVPVDENFNITDDTRIRGALPTLKKIIADGGSAIIASHMGRPKKNPDSKYSLKVILSRVSELLGVDVKFAPDCVGDEAFALAAALKPGEALLLENLRFYAEEEGKPRGLAEDATDEEKKAAKTAVKASQKEFTKKLASLADTYVNDAFGTAHRAHASTALIADYFDSDHKLFGFLMEKEVTAVKKVMSEINRPFTAIMGGSKVSSKIEIIENLLTKVDNLIITGGMTYTFTKALGGKIGNSLCEDDKLELALSLLEKAKANGVKLVLAVDAKIADSFSNDAKTNFVSVDEIPDGWMGLDIGPETEKNFAEIIKSSKTILWNGPTGVFEFANFEHGTRSVGEAVVEATKNGAFSLVGGGDSVAAVNKFGIADKVSYVSTGGGALLEAIQGIPLPGIVTIEGK